MKLKLAPRSSNKPAIARFLRSIAWRFLLPKIANPGNPQSGGVGLLPDLAGFLACRETLICWTEPAFSEDFAMKLS
jgi:hypothetical protein